jgi:hypothetical protein
MILPDGDSHATILASIVCKCGCRRSCEFGSKFNSEDGNLGALNVFLNEDIRPWMSKHFSNLSKGQSQWSPLDRAWFKEYESAPKWGRASLTFVCLRWLVTIGLLILDSMDWRRGLGLAVADAGDEEGVLSAWTDGPNVKKVSIAVWHVLFVMTLIKIAYMVPDPVRGLGIELAVGQSAWILFYVIGTWGYCCSSDETQSCSVMTRRWQFFVHAMWQTIFSSVLLS